MKKTLVLFLILAVVAGGLFAQVSWSGAVSGNAKVDFDPAYPTVTLNAYDGDREVNDSSVSMKYTNGDWNVSLGFGTASALAADDATARLSATLNYDTGNYGFTAKAKAGTGLGFPITDISGYYKFMDGDLTVNATIRGGRRGGEVWHAWDTYGKWDTGNVNSLIFNYTGIENLNVGVFLPNVFTPDGYFFSGVGANSVLRNMVIGGKYSDGFTAAANLKLTPFGTDDFSMDFKADFAMDNVADVTGLTFKLALIVTDLMAKGTMDMNAKAFVAYGMDLDGGISVGADATFGMANLFTTSTQAFNANLTAGLSGDLDNDWGYGVDFGVHITILPDVAANITLDPSVTWSVSNAYLNVGYSVDIGLTPTFDFSHYLGVACKWNF